MRTLHKLQILLREEKRILTLRQTFYLSKFCLPSQSLYNIYGTYAVRTYVIRTINSKYDTGRVLVIAYNKVANVLA